MPVKKAFPVIELDGKAFAVFYEDMRRAFSWFGLGYNAVHKWADRNGNGILSPLGAQTLKSFIKNTMDGESGWSPHWEPLSVEQIAFKNERNAFTSPWKMEGNIYRNITVRKVGSAWVVGVDKRVTVPKIGFRTYANIRGATQKIKVETYAAMMEFGFESEKANIPERPLFLPAFAKFRADTVPELIKLVEKSMWSVSNLYRISEYTSSKAMGDTGSVIGQSSIDYSKGMEPNKHFSPGVLEDMQRSEFKIEASLGGLAGNAKKQEAAIKKQDQEDLDNFNNKHKVDVSGYTPEQIAMFRKFGYKL